jgi:hypothetical protein
LWGGGAIGGVAGEKGIDGRNEGGLAGRPPGGEGCGEKACEAGGEETPWVHHDVLHGKKNVVGGNGGGDRLEESAGDLEAENNPESRTEKAEEKRFGDEEKDHGVLGESKRTEKADFRSTTNHIGGDGIGDEKHADDECDEREGGEVKLEGAEHFFDFLATAFGRTGSDVGGEVGCEAFEKGGAGCGNFSRCIGAQESFDAVDLAG